MDKKTVWLKAYAAALAGTLAAETETWKLSNRADVARVAGVLADFSVAEFAKRFGPFPMHT